MDLKRDQQTLDLLQGLQNAENLKELKIMLGNRSWSDFLSILKDIHKVHQNATEQQQQLQEDFDTLRIKYLDLKEYLTNLQNRNFSPDDKLLALLRATRLSSSGYRLRSRAPDTHEAHRLGHCGSLFARWPAAGIRFGRQDRPALGYSFRSAAPDSRAIQTGSPQWPSHLRVSR